MNDYINYRDNYNKCREEERIKLRNHLINQGFKDISTRGTAGKGRKNYTSGKRFINPYNLTNWKYIECTYDGVSFLISLQPHEIDPSSHNTHSLIDRIGIFPYIGKYSSEKSITNTLITDIELPLDDTSMEKLVQILRDLAICQNELNKVCEKYNLV